MNSSTSSNPIRSQPNQPPNPWQLCGPALGHLVLYSQDLNSIRVRLPIISKNRTAIGSGPRSTIRFNHSDCDSLHLRLSISNHYQASIQVIGHQGIKLNNVHHFPNENHWINLLDGDLFYIAHWPFKWEQRYNIKDLNWSLYKLDSIDDPETKKLVNKCLELCNQQNSKPLLNNISKGKNDEKHLGILETNQLKIGNGCKEQEEDLLKLDSINHRPSSISSDSDSEEVVEGEEEEQISQKTPEKPRLRLIITPKKPNSPLTWSTDEQQAQPSIDMNNISFRRRSSRRSIEINSSKRARVNGPIDESSEEEEEEEEEEGKEEDAERTDKVNDLPPSIPISPGRRLSRFLPGELKLVEPVPNILDQADQSRPRRKSLLQKILIKRAVEVHLAQTNEVAVIPEAGCSGFSSSDEEEEEEEEGEGEGEGEGEEDEDEDEEGSDKDDKSTNIHSKKNSSLGLSSPSFISQNEAHRIFSTDQPEDPIPSTSTNMINTISPTHFQQPIARRSISPNAKLLKTYQSSTTKTPSPTNVEFPLKSSFRRDSYTPEELQSFSITGNNKLESTNLNKNKLKYNTQLNSISPSYTEKDEQRQINERRRSYRKSNQNFETLSNINKKEESIPSSSTSPTNHRIIRTPRSFLIKRGGSLTPLGKPSCGIINHNNTPDQDIIGELGKRKVRFEEDVFCLEFDQLPEEFGNNNDHNDKDCKDKNKKVNDNCIDQQPKTKKSKVDQDLNSITKPSQPLRSNRRRKSSDQVINNRSSNRSRSSLRNTTTTTSRPTHHYSTRRSRSEEICLPEPSSSKSHSRLPSSMSELEGSISETLAPSTSSIPERIDSSTQTSFTINQIDQNNDSIITQIKHRFFNLGIGNIRTGTVVRPRSCSLPTKVSNYNKTSTDGIEKEIEWLSLDSISNHPYLSQHHPRAKSAPTSFDSSGRTLPQFKAFEPQLIGVKEMLLKPFIHRLSLPTIDVSNWRNVFGGNWRSNEDVEGDESSSESSSIVIQNEEEGKEAKEIILVGHEDPSSSTSTINREDHKTVEIPGPVVEKEEEEQQQQQPKLNQKASSSRRKQNDNVVTSLLTDENLLINGTRTLRPRSNTSRTVESQPKKITTTANRKKNCKKEVNETNNDKPDDFNQKSIDNNNVEKKLLKNKNSFDEIKSISPRKTRSRSRTQIMKNEENNHCKDHKKVIDLNNNNESQNGIGNINISSKSNNNNNTRKRTQSQK
ncbi:hypothetical protein CROQUDRAFT_104915 [Cronartium quercuum f. sp. fusiforme G11]|uniref:FHA domain-containing protein n=1 Tax=Cronartium quercuum f. sp. fusiforme G11 TaxID=708437 RepID=A0A9P6NP84_9BASI|nr:hypothetical protein CROQUDRAFT_104915 [Cronartium quercuum f. sp. fusiforme G11]